MPVTGTPASTLSPIPHQGQWSSVVEKTHSFCTTLSSGPCELLGDVNAEELKAAHPLHRCLVEGDVCVYSAQSPEIHHQHLGLVNVE